MDEIKRVLGELATPDEICQATGLRYWQLVRLYGRPDMPEGIRVGRVTHHRRADVPAIRAAAVAAGYLREVAVAHA
jgi:hypothetical protein